MALVEPCDTNGEDANISLVSYKNTLTPRIIDLAAIKGVVGRVKLGLGKEWGIIDRSADLLDPERNEDPELIDEMLD